ncbi:MAG: DedA family protein [Deltaproteobacteria bacterium]|nr:DedA family protein [Deltaproteobacteria bacterium]
MQETLLSLARDHACFFYGAMIFFAFAEGPYLSLFMGAFIKFGYFPFWPVYICIMAGDLIGDVFWYQIGKYFGYKFVRRFGKYFDVDEESVAKVHRIFHDYKSPILFISKITCGFGLALATLMTAGMIRIPFGWYLSVNILGQFIWTGMLIGMGYFFSHMYMAINSVIGKVFIAATFLAYLYAFSRYRRYLQKKAKQI